MRYKVSPTVHRNLAASKRSIVIMCAAIALVLGTTSVGASSFFVANDPAPATSNANPVASGGDIAAGELPLPPVANKPLGIQQPLNFGPKPHTQTGRIGIEIGPVSVAAIITQIKKITQPPEITIPAITIPTTPVIPATSTPPSIPIPPVTPPPVIADPVPDPTPTDPPIQEPPATEEETPPEPSLGIQNTNFGSAGSTALAQ